VAWIRNSALASARDAVIGGVLRLLRDSAAVVVVLVATAGCSITGPSGTSAVRTTPLPAREVVEPPSALEAPQTLETLAHAALANAESPEVRQSALHAAGGSEFRYFQHLLLGARKETRDVSVVLQETAEAIGLRENDSEAAALVHEVAAHECCMRRGFLSASLRGLVQGLAARGASLMEDSGAARALSELARNPDLELAEAARAAGAYFAGFSEP
jgi:hypothetical protein